MSANIGELVTVRAYGGELLERVVVEKHARGVLVCRQEEYEKAKREGREPAASGFPWEDVINEDRRRSAGSHAPTSDEFDAFRRLTQRLVAVPRKELNRKLAADKARKKKQRAT